MNVSRNMVAALLVASMMLCVLPGCLISSSNTTYETGQKVSSSTKSQIKRGETTSSWLVATLGEPSSKETVQEDDPRIEIWRYDYQERRESDGAVFLLFAGSSSETNRTTTWFEVKDGIVTDHWSE